MSTGTTRGSGGVAWLAAFVNPIVSGRLQRDPSVPREPESFDAEGAVLLADVSGFTTLTETCARKGPAGAEEVREFLNAHFAPLVERVTAYGGQVLHFAGDAAIAWFPVDGAPAAGLASAASRAIACGRQVARQADASPSGGGTLPVRVGIGAGKVTAAIVGGASGSWEAVLAGPALANAVTALQQASAGEVVLAPELRGHAGSAARAHEGVNVDAPLLPEAAEAALRSFLPRALLARIDAGQTNWLGEFRQVSVLFAGVRDLDFGKDGCAQAHTLTRALQTAVFENEGTVVQYVVDDKATTLVAVWGLALQTHEDDAVRAVRAATRIHAEVERLGHQCGVGVASGRAFAGIRGTERRCDYAVIGDVVNLAARLMEASDARVLADTATRSAARRRVLFEALSPIDVKGRSERVPVYRPLREKRRLGRDQREMVGRSRERDVLLDAIRRVASTRTSELVIVEGEPGIGKSRLVSALLEYVATSALRPIVVQGDAIERSTPLHAWRGVVAGLLGYDEIDPTAARGRLLAMLAAYPELLPFAPLANALFPMGLAETAETTSLTAEGRGERTRDLLVQLLRTLAPEGAALVLEDAQWIDSASWALVAAMMDRVHPLLAVVTTRPVIPDRLPDEARRLLARPSATTINLAPLDTDDIVALACQRLDVDVLPGEVARLIRERSEGHPLFAGELAAALRDRGLLRVVDGDCVLAVDEATLHAQRLPTTVEGIVTSRLDLMPATHQMTLKVASAFGRTFSADALAEVHPIPSDLPLLADQLSEMVALDLIEPEPSGPARSYRFTHAIIEEVAYGLLPFAQRRQLHGAIGAWLERRQAAGVDVSLALLSEHWLKAGDVPKAIVYMERAGTHALEQDNNQEAVRFFTDAIGLAAEPEGRVPVTRLARWHSQLAEAFYHLDRFDDAIGHIQQALGMLGIAVPESPAGRRRMLATQILVQASHLTRLPRQRTGNAEVASIATKAAGLWAWIEMSRRDSFAMIVLSLLAVNQAERAGAPSVFGRAILAAMATAMGMRALGRRYFDQAYEEGIRINAVRELSMAALYDAMDLLGGGRHARALSVLDDALTRARNGRSRVYIAQLLTVESVILGFVGRMTDARRLAAEAVEALPNAPCHERFHVVSMAIAFEALARAGGEALETFEENAPYLQSLIQGHDRVATTTLSSIRLAVLLRAGRFDDAFREADALYELLVQDFRSTFSLQWLMLFGLGDAFTARVQRVHGTATAAAALKRARDYSTLLWKFARKNPVYEPQARLVEGRIRMATGDADAARQTWRAAIDRAMALGLPAEEARARFELGRSLPPGDERRELLAKAQELFVAGGMSIEGKAVADTVDGRDSS